MEEMEDCFARDNHRGICKVLAQGSGPAARRGKICTPKDCSFKQTVTEAWDGRQKAWDRIQGLPPAERIHIIDKYYGGKMPKDLLTS